MKKKLYYICFIYFLAVLTAAPAYAQKWLKSTEKALERNRARLTHIRPKIPNAVLTQINRVVAQHHPRIHIGTQQALGIPKITAIRNTLNAGYQISQTAPRPRLQETYSFPAADFTRLIPAKLESGEEPVLIPFQNQRGLIYRGLALNADGAAVRNILKNGLRVQDVGKESNTLIASMAGPMSRSAAVRAPITNLTDAASSAVMWAEKRLGDGQIPVITVVKSTQKGDIITTDRDIPAEDIYAVVALLNINGKRTWCKVELDGDDFRITPYVPFSESSQP